MGEGGGRRAAEGGGKDDLEAHLVLFKKVLVRECVCGSITNDGPSHLPLLSNCSVLLPPKDRNPDAHRSTPLPSLPKRESWAREMKN